MNWVHLLQGDLEREGPMQDPASERQSDHPESAGVGWNLATESLSRLLGDGPGGWEGGLASGMQAWGDQLFQL